MSAWRLLQGECLALLHGMADDSVDAVLHRTPGYGGKRRQFWDDLWTVSDPVTGAAMARGASMVMAVMCYRHIVQMQGSEWDAFLERNRQSYVRKREGAEQ